MLDSAFIGGGLGTFYWGVHKMHLGKGKRKSRVFVGEEARVTAGRSVL
jgi:hypothetical protein